MFYQFTFRMHQNRVESKLPLKVLAPMPPVISPFNIECTICLCSNLVYVILVLSVSPPLKVNLQTPCYD